MRKDRQANARKRLSVQGGSKGSGRKNTLARRKNSKLQRMQSASSLNLQATIQEFHKTQDISDLGTHLHAKLDLNKSNNND